MNIHTTAESTARKARVLDMPFLYALDSTDTAQLLNICRILASAIDCEAYALTVYALKNSLLPTRYFLSVRGELPKELGTLLLEYGRRIVSGVSVCEHAVLLYLKEHAERVSVAPLI